MRTLSSTSKQDLGKLYWRCGLGAFSDNLDISSAYCGTGTNRQTYADLSELFLNLQACVPSDMLQDFFCFFQTTG